MWYGVETCQWHISKMHGKTNYRMGRMGAQDACHVAVSEM